jgi:hypothetical protein
MMKTLRTAFGLVLAATVGLLAAAPAMAAEERVVPPENSAAHQYTEAFPTARGDKDAHAQRGRDLNPGKVIGSKKAKALSDRGEDGRDVAELTAETAPNPAPVEPVVETTDESAAPPAGNGNGGGSGKDRAGDRGTSSAPAPRVETVRVAPVEGSSGFSEVLARATGSGSSGGMGIFLPLIIIASVLWALAYATRQRRPVG